MPPQGHQILYDGINFYYVDISTIENNSAVDFASRVPIINAGRQIYKQFS